MGGFGQWGGGKMHEVGYTYISGSAAFGITERSRKLARYTKQNTQKKQKPRMEVPGGGCVTKGKRRWTADGAKVLCCSCCECERRRVHVVDMYV